MIKKKTVEVSDLVIGDLVVVKVGEQVPVDGIIEKGATSLNQAAITGEFVPIYLEKGQSVHAGSINIESTIIVQTSKDPKHSVVQKIVNFVEKAQSEKTKSQSFIDRFEKMVCLYCHLICNYFNAYSTTVKTLSSIF